MARKLSLKEIRGAREHVSRLMSSLQYPLSPEGKRVLKAANAGLKLIRDSRVIEENFPDSIRDMLVMHRKEMSNAHPTQPLRPDQA